MADQPSGGPSGFLHLVERQMLFHEELRKVAQRFPSDGPTGPYRFITISRDVGALGDIVASELADRLKWTVYDKEIVDYIARNGQVRQSLVDQLDERARSRVHDTIARFLHAPEARAFGNDEYHAAMLRALLTLAARDKVILLGHGGAFALREQPGLHVRITASLSRRIARMSQRWEVSPDDARRRVLRVDEERRGFIRYHFNEDREDPRFFHLIFNTDRFAVGHVVAAIATVVEQSSMVAAAASPPPAFERISFQNAESDAGRDRPSSFVHS